MSNQKGSDEIVDLLDIMSSISNADDDEDDGLSFEKNVLKSVMKQIEELTEDTDVRVRRKKNSRDSAAYRKKGNDFYSGQFHDASVHQTAWKLYTQSIALAPNNSEDLAMAYGNRSALLFHLGKFEDCIKDCDKGFKITNSDLLKAKLKFRKIDCLVALRKDTSKSECEDALALVKDLTFNEDLKDKFIHKLNATLKIASDLDSETEDQEAEDEAQEVKLPTFEHQTESPCASTSVAIAFDKYYGRHVVATQDIEPGEIIAVEKSYYGFLYPEGMYLHCSNCLQPSWTLIPCEDCIYDVYCSDKCKSEARDKYHKFECKVFPYLWDIELDRKACPSCVRFMLISVHKAGGIKQLRDELIIDQKCTDPRTKGFSDDGIFDSASPRSAYSLCGNGKEMDKNMVTTMAQNACDAVYYLATKSKFFGMKLNTSRTKMLLSKDVLFIGAVILRNFFLLSRNNFTLDAYHSYFETNSKLGVSFYPFCSFFNHSCDANASQFTSKVDELVIFAKKPIKKGSQVFLFYGSHNFLCETKEERQEYLKYVYQFTCKCLPCKENWPKDFLKPIADILKNKPKLLGEMQLVLQNLTIFKKDPDAKNLKYDEQLMKEIVNALQTLAKKVTVNSTDYECLFEYLSKMYIKSFGNWFINIPHKCIKL